MTPEEVQAELRTRGYRLERRVGGLRLTGQGEPDPNVVCLVREHRSALLGLLETHSRACEMSEASLAAGRVTPFPTHLLKWVHPSIRDLMVGR